MEDPHGKDWTMVVSGTPGKEVKVSPTDLELVRGFATERYMTRLAPKPDKDPAFWAKCDQVWQKKLEDGSKLEIQIAKSDNKMGTEKLSLINSHNSIEGEVKIRVWHTQGVDKNHDDGVEKPAHSVCYQLVIGEGGEQVWVMREANSYHYNAGTDSTIWAWGDPKPVSAQIRQLDIMHKLDTMKIQAEKAAQVPKDQEKKPQS